MSYSTMYKKGALLLTVFLLLLPYARIRAQESVNSEILVIYESGEGQDYLEQVQTLVEHLTYMGHSVSYMTVPQALNDLDKFSRVIAFRLRQDRTRLAQRLAGTDGGRFIIGSEFFQTFYNAGGGGGKLIAADQEKGELVYEFAQNQTRNAAVRVPDLLSLSGEGLYENGKIYAGGREYPFCSGTDNVRYTPVVDYSGEILQAALIEELTYWLWPYNDQPHTYGQYLVLDQIYPFTDPQQLLDKIERFVQNKISFVLSVMPVYQNQTYPAMQQFCEVLKYAQANGGAIILHAPILQTADPELVQLQEYLTTATEAYIQMGVYPVGIEVPKDWTQNENCLTVLKRYSTVFIRNMETYIRTQDFFRWDYNILFYNYHQLIPEVVSAGGSHVSDISWYSAATYLDNGETDLQDIDEVVREFKFARTVQKSLYDMHHEVWANNLHLSYKDHIMKLNEQVVSLEYVPQEKDGEYDYHRNTLQKISFDLQKESGVLLLISFGAILIFLGMMIWGRRTNRKHFFPDPKDTQDQESKKER